MKEIKVYFELLDGELEVENKIYLGSFKDTKRAEEYEHKFEKMLQEVIEEHKTWAIGTEIPVEDARRFVIRDKEEGNEITRARSVMGARNIIDRYEEEDKQEGIYTENFYEIYDTETNEIIK